MVSNISYNVSSCDNDLNFKILFLSEYIPLMISLVQLSTPLRTSPIRCAQWSIAIEIPSSSGYWKLWDSVNCISGNTHV